MIATARPGKVLGTARWLRSYFVVALLAGAVGWTFVGALAGKMPPNPEFPPFGYAVEQDSTQLEWSTGSRKGDVRIEVAIDTPSFDGAKILDKTTRGTTYNLTNLRQGRTYFWRVTQAGRESRISRFSVKPDALRY
jgi:hypothetical protein